MYLQTAPRCSASLLQSHAVWALRGARKGGQGAEGVHWLCHLGWLARWLWACFLPPEPRRRVSSTRASVKRLPPGPWCGPSACSRQSVGWQRRLEHA